MTRPQRPFPIPHVPVHHDSGRHNVVTCLVCGRDSVRFVNVQVASVFGPTDVAPVQHVTVWTDSGKVEQDQYPTAGRDAQANRRPRIALTFRCEDCGEQWAAVVTHWLGQTFAYRSQPTARAAR